MRNSTNTNSSISSSNNNNRYVTTTTVRDHNKIQQVEKVVYDNRIKRKNVLALNEKVAAIREYEKRPIYKRIGRMFQCSPDQIKRIVQQKETILNAWEQRTRKCRDAKTLEMKVVRVSMLGKAVYEWIRRMMYYKDILITDGLIQKMALQFKSAMGLQNFFPHQDWCDKFRSTYKIFTCDSKTLNIAYSQGHSVQIKDVMKDVLSECCPTDGDDENDTDDGGDLDDDCMSIDSDEDDDDGPSQINNNPRKKVKSRLLTKDNSKTVVYPKPATIQTMQGLRQLMALPIQGNGLAGMGQKVLVATPIVQPGQKQGSGPMTMTIIPLASLGQHQNNINTTPMTAALSPGCYTQNCASRNDNNNNNNDDIPIPTPMVEIKQEIKEEPKEDDAQMVRTLASIEEEDAVKIKKEYITDDEDDCNRPNKQIASMISHMPTLLPAHVVSIPLHNRDMLEESSKDSMDDLTLSSLRKRIKIEETSADQNDKRDKSSEIVNDDEHILSSPETQSTSKMPPMPPLTKAPTLNATSMPPTAISTCHVVPPTARSDTRTLQSSPDACSNSQELPAIRTCSEARKYLKLLEDFALERENFRLIGLITRADEVLRELDRKENSDGGDNEDVDVD